MKGYYIKATAGGGTTLSTAKLMKTGQTISYQTGDDGDLQEGRDVDFFTLAENNPFSNTNRFTDELGGQTYVKRITIDWSTYDGSTVLGWKMDPILTLGINWFQAISLAQSSFGGFTTGWRLPNIREMFSIINFGNITPLANNIGGGHPLWTSTTVSNFTSTAWLYNSSFIQTNKISSSGYRNYVAVRTFTVTGTTLS